MGPVGVPGMTPVWFARFGDIPGVDYRTPPGVDLTRLADRGAKPKVGQFDNQKYLTWATADGSTSRSPAGERAFADREGASATAILTNVAEGLELPGEPSDYHFLLQGAATALYSMRRADASLMEQAHRLYLLDLQLIQAQPDAVRLERDGQDRFVSILGLPRLLKMYLNEGRVADAVAIAEIAERFGAGAMPDVAAARVRAAALAAEDASGAAS